jgi:hypothetical protein
MANYVFMMDTWWNEAIEQQAIDRVHRLGQNKPVFVVRYVIKGTVEKRILKIRELVGAALVSVCCVLRGGGGGVDGVRVCRSLLGRVGGAGMRG